MDEKFDAIIVGAGLAGSTAALCMAQAGLEVLMIERGSSTGSKNMTGGRLYSHSLSKIIPEFWKEAPVERKVSKEQIAFLTDSSAVSLNISSSNFDEFPSFTVLRSSFDSWLASKAEEAGAILAEGVLVEELVVENGRVIGVKSGEDVILADVVIVAEGVNSLLLKRAGLMQEFSIKDLSVGVKEVIGIPANIIEERFNIDSEQGATQLFVGSCTKGLQGGGFLYTNKESLSLGLVIGVNEFNKTQEALKDLMEEFKQHPYIKPLIKDGEVIEYSAHLIPESGLNMVKTLYGDGFMVVGDAAGLVLNTGYTVRGMDFAIASGEAAATIVIKAKRVEDYSSKTLIEYQKALENSFVLKDLKTFHKAPSLLENERIYEAYPLLLEDVLTKLFVVNGEPQERLRNSVIHSVGKHGGLWHIAKDIVKGVASQ